MRFVCLALVALCLLSLAPSCGAFGNRRLCGIQLVEALLFVCGEKGLFYHPGRRVREENIRIMMRDSASLLRETRMFLESGERERMSGNRVMKRGIVEQCCHFYCNYYDLENYCNI
ncbi:insulin [Megalops cyprinoides]|uniref:insulin n=1 Tax=Megalops cyprinoides TaxID=118141 RepID=UPI001863E487|nr:insulin [Megalops cyprinoides]